MLVFVVGCGATVQVASSAAETGLVRQVFACDFVNGAGMEELLAARDNMVAKIPQIGVKAVDGFLWTPFKGNFSYDVLWFDNFENLNHWGADSVAWAASPVGAEVDAVFNEVIDCGSGLSVRENIYEGGESLPTGGNGRALISSSACKLQDGKNINDVRAAIATLKSTLDGLGTHKSFVAYMTTPLTNSSDNDLYFYGVHPDASTYAARTTAIRTSEAGQRMGAQFREALDCQASLWWGQQIVTGE